jgi:hypothetical protein
MTANPTLPATARDATLGVAPDERMPMPRLLLLACLTLAACGADGPPETPKKPANPGITMSGEVGVGVVSN